jgi:hypothetical protein
MAGYLRSLRVCWLAVAVAVALLASAVSAAATDRPNRIASDAALAYVTGSVSMSEGTVWLAAANGMAAHRITASFSPALSPDGREVALTPDTGRPLAVYAASGALVGGFFAVERWVVHALAWSPDSRYLAVALQPAGGIRHPGVPYLALIDTRTGVVRTIADGLVEGLSFAPATPDRLVYGLDAARARGGPGLYTASVPAGRVQRMTDGLNPVWGHRGIVFDRERRRTRNGTPTFPIYQLFLLAGTHVMQITHMSVSYLGDGLVPVALSADGTRLAANWVGEDTDQAWSVNLLTHHLHEFPAGLTAAGISRDGRRVLLESMFGLLFSPATSRIETMPFSGGSASVLVTHGGEASWNQ